MRKIIYAYPERKKEYNELHQQSVTANLSCMPGSNNVSRRTENIATKELSPTKQKEYDAVSQAIEITRKMHNGRLRLKMIEHIYWKNAKKTVEGAAVAVGYSEDRGKQIHKEFVRLVGGCYGFDL